MTSLFVERLTFTNTKQETADCVDMPRPADRKLSRACPSIPNFTKCLRTVSEMIPNRDISRAVSTITVDLYPTGFIKIRTELISTDFCFPADLAVVYSWTTAHSKSQIHKTMPDSRGGFLYYSCERRLRNKMESINILNQPTHIYRFRKTV